MKAYAQTPDAFNGSLSAKVQFINVCMYVWERVYGAHVLATMTHLL